MRQKPSARSHQPDPFPYLITPSMLQQAFAPLMGQSQAVEMLTQAIARHHIAPGYLFMGPHGVGKRLACECFVQLLLQPQRSTHTKTKTPDAPSALSSTALAALRHRIQQRNHPDLLWVEPTYLHQGKRLSIAEAQEKGLKRRSPPILRLDQIREIGQFLSRPPLEAAQSVVVLDQAETMAEAAANALLKTLEEPGHATLILIAPDEDSLLPTLISRCQTIPFRRLPPDPMTHVLQQLGHDAIVAHPQVMQLAQGSPGEAIASWTALQTIEEQAPQLLATLQQPPRTLRQALATAQTIAKTLDIDTQVWLIGYLQHTYWHQMAASLGSGASTLPQLTHQLQRLEQSRQHLRRYVQPRLVWEVLMMDLAPSASGVPALR